MTNTSFDTPRQTISWPRIAGTSFAIALHVVVFMALMAPISGQQKVDKEEDVTLVSFIEPPKPPPPEAPPIVYNDPSPVAYEAPPPAPPAPAPVVQDFGGEIDATGRAMNPPQYPPEEQRRGVTGTVTISLSYDPNGNVLEVQVIKSSGNRNLDRAAVKAAKRWKINPAVRNGVRVAGVAKTDVVFVLN